MEFHEIDAVGPIKIERLDGSTTPTYSNLTDVGRFIYMIGSGKAYFGNNIEWVEISGVEALLLHKVDPDGHPLASTSAPGFLRILSNNSNEYLNGTGNWSVISDGTGIKRTITQTHAFTVGNIIRLDGTTYIKAQANSVENAEVVGIVTSVTGTTAFVVTLGGYVSGLTGLIAGNVYFLSETTAGLMTNTEPTSAGQISKPVFLASSTTEGYFINWRGSLIPDEEPEESDVPVGTVIAWPQTDIPDGYLECDGSLKSTSTYSDLYSVLGTSYGTGSGTFGLPDYRGTFLRGLDGGRGIDIGRVIGTYQEDALKAHTHSLATYVQYGLFSGSPALTSLSGSSNTGSTGGTETRPINMSVKYCIKY